MFFPAHLAAGLIIGNVTGEYAPSIIAAMGPDLDHAISYFRSGVLFRPKEFFHAITTSEDPAGDQRNFLHNIVSWIIISIAVGVITEARLGWIVAAGYLSHLILDILDSADFYPFYPSQRINWKGPIHYLSRQETIVTIVLFLVYFLF